MVFKVKIKKNLLAGTKINKYSFLMVLLYIMPFVDSVSGAFHDELPIGQIYRLVLFFYMLTLLMTVSKRTFINVLFPFMVFLLIQSIVSSNYIKDSLQGVIKLFTPIILVSLIQTLQKEKKYKLDIFNLMDFWSIAYPVLILVPGLMGIGISAYEGEIGWKGFFYAVNEISFILSSLVAYMFWRLNFKSNMYSLFVLAFNCLCVALMVTKMGYATVFVFLILFIFAFMRNENQKQSLKILILICFLVFVIIYYKDQIIQSTSLIFERWRYLRKHSYSTTDFLFSMRLRRLNKAITLFTKEMHYLFGWGFGGSDFGYPNMEMDFLDLLFQTGIFGLFYILYFYGKQLVSVFHKNLWGVAIIIWSLALSFGAGHVLFYGQSGMMLAANIILAYEIKSQTQNRK